VAEDGVAVDDLFPALIEVAGEAGVGREDWAEAELDVGLGYDLLEDEPFVDFVPTVGEAARVQEDDAVAGDAEVFQVGVEGEEAALPSGLAEVEEAVQPFADFSRVFEAGEVVVEGALDARGGFGDGESADEAADVDFGGWEGDDFGNQRSSFEVLLSEALAAAVACAVDAPHLFDVRAEPDAGGDDAHRSLQADAKGTQGPGRTLQEGAGQDLPEENQSYDLRWCSGALDDPVFGGVHHFAYPFAKAFEASGGQFGWSV
jgi:hypothetical protein